MRKILAPELNRAVFNFTAAMLPLSDNELEHAWRWENHGQEDIRFAFFVTLQELHRLAVTLAALRPKPSPAQHI